MLPSLRTVCAVTLLASCATTVGSTWRAPDFAGPPLRRVLLCALSRDDGTRRLLEDTFARELLANGVTGVPCYTVLPPGPPNAQRAREAAAIGGFDGIIVTRPASVKENIINEGGGPGFSAWGSSYQTEYARTETEVNVQARVFSSRGSGGDGELIWVGTSETLDPASIRNLVFQIVPRLIGAMADARVLPPRRSPR